MDTKEFIFNLYKDQVVPVKKFKSEIKRKYHLDSKEVSDLYVRINNYQVKTYGQRLVNDIEVHTREEMSKIHKAAKDKRHFKTKNYADNSRFNRKFDYL